MIDEPSNESVVPAHPALDDSDQLSGEGAIDSVAYHECISQIDRKLDDIFSTSLELGARRIDIDIPPDAETQRLVSAELLFRLERRLKESGFEIVLSDGQCLQDRNGRVANFKVISIVKFAIIGTIEVLSDIDSTNIPALLARRYWENARLRDKLLEQERLDDLKATLTQAFEQSGLSEDKRETFLRETFSIIAKLQSPETAACALPDEAPELYVGNRGGKKGGENIVDFLRRVWKPWIEAGVLSRPDLRRLDPKADAAVNNWLRVHEFPDDIKIPKLSELNDLALGQPDVLREARRLNSALSRRLRKKNLER